MVQDWERGMDEIVTILSDRHRREALAILRDQPDGVATLEELGEQMSSVTADRQGDRSKGDDVTANDVSILLHHVHLPGLADAGFVDYDQRSKVVRYYGDSVVEEMLDRA